ncbi:MAG: DUF1036 domain-containing protein [Hyphomicrobiaceae bacterium]
MLGGISRRGGRLIGRGILAGALSAAFLSARAEPARADLRLCNATSSRIGVAIGYQDSKGWATEGWWTIASQSCETLLRGGVPSRFIYVHAIDYDRGGEWAGTNIMCTTDKSFWIRDIKDCERRGHRPTGFFEVDTGTAKDWTIRLADPQEASNQQR